MEGGVLAADVDEVERLGAGEDVVGGPLERVLAALVAVDGHGRLSRRLAPAVAPLGTRPPHGGGDDGRLLAPGVVVLGLRDDRRRVQGVRRRVAEAVVVEEEEGIGGGVDGGDEGWRAVGWWWGRD